MVCSNGCGWLSGDFYGKNIGIGPNSEAKWTKRSSAEIAELPNSQISHGQLTVRIDDDKTW